MIILIVLSTLLCLVLFLLLLCTRRELTHLAQQLEHIEKGSHMELTTRLRSRHFLDVYRRLNRILSCGQNHELRQLRAQKQLKQTIVDIAHDIRTPLTSASGYLQMLEEISHEEKQLRYEKIIENRLAELKEMLEELFLYTKLKSDDFHLECTDTAIYPVLSNSLISLYHLFEQKQTQPQVTFPQENLRVSADPQALGRVFCNLIQNALIHGKGSLYIVQEENVIHFSNLMENEPDQNLVNNPSLIFDRFYKADQARGKGSSGLGLAVVKELMQQMGGRAEARINGSFITILLVFQTVSEDR